MPIAVLPAALAQQPMGMALRRTADRSQPASPDWMKDLIIYEVATKGFTSPRGAESGTFNSLRSRLAYLQELGITGIWLTGYSLCDPHHFYNIWTQYAVIEPDKFDPTLGTAEEFRQLIHEAHRRGIRVFLDVITHGLMKDSPVIKQHPAWFRGGSWGMTDFDWTGGHTDLDDWWVKIYSDFVTVYGVDGYRLDVNIYRPDLWERIRRNTAAAGHSIVIWEESNAVIPGVTDFTQGENNIATHEANVLNQVLVNDLPGFYDRKFGRSGFYEVQIQFEDGSSMKGNTNGDGPLGVHLAGLSADRVSRRRGDTQPDGLPDVRITLENVHWKPIANITVQNDMGDEWQLRAEGWESRPLVVDAPESSGSLVAGTSLDIYIATLAWGSSILLSCHDNGWTGFPLDKNPYVAQGSRSMFGYSFLFSPMIPIFFSGEEFNAAFHALPELTPDLYGGKDAGKGRWLYGAMLDWNEVNLKYMILPFVREIFAELEHSSGFERVRRHLSLGAGRRRVSGLTATARSLYLPLMARAARQPVIVVVADNKAAEALEPMLRAGCELTGAVDPPQWCGCRPTMCFLSKIYLLIRMCRSSGRRRCGSWPPARSILIAPVESAALKLFDRDYYAGLAVTLKRGEEVDVEVLTGHLASVGYTQMDLVEMPGQFTRRGGILDVYSPEADRPVRIEFFGDEIETIRKFDPETQRSQSGLDEAQLLPLTETPVTERLLAAVHGRLSRQRLS
jgi:hypothetical protein